jgi:hypothetical protein
LLCFVVFLASSAAVAAAIGVIPLAALMVTAAQGTPVAVDLAVNPAPAQASS